MAGQGLDDRPGIGQGDPNADNHKDRHVQHPVEPVGIGGPLTDHV